MIRCLNCFCKYDESLRVCPYCGSQADVRAIEPIHLTPGTLIGGRYTIGVSIGSGGFGIIYRAFDRKMECTVAVKEFYPSRIVTRAEGTKDIIINGDGREEFDYRKKRFLAEARNMAKFGSHRNIVNVFEYFEENNTAYIVMELLEGESLSDYLRENDDRVAPDFAIYVTNEVGNALTALHKEGIIHRDVAPDNIYICTSKDIKVKLLDLGSAQLSDEDADVTDIILKPGYSPVEQYDKRKNIDDSTDVYALGATLYVMLTGVKPDESTNRKIVDNVKAPNEIIPTISENLSNAVMKAMAVEKHLRFKTVQEFLKAINGEKKIISLKKEKLIRKIKQIGSVVAALGLITVGAIFVKNYYDNKRLETELNPATISVWYSADENSEEQAAMEEVKADFESTYEGVTIELTRIDPDKYATEVKKAAEAGELPNLFESSGLDSEILEECIDVDNVLASDVAADCLFIDQYDNYYADHKKMPLGIEVPVACLINKGPVQIDYSDSTFGSEMFMLTTGPVALNDDCYVMWDSMMDVSNCCSESEFSSDPTAPVLLTSTMEIGMTEQYTQQYQHSYSYYISDKIYCRFVYEWSIGTGDEDQTRAAERLLTFMLGNRYQDYLMLATNSEAWELPVCKETFLNKITERSNFYSGIDVTYESFVFEKGEELITTEPATPTPSPTPSPTPTPTPIPNPEERYVGILYEEILDREADEGGLGYYTDMVIQNGGDPSAVVLSLFGSTEFVERNLSNEEYVTILYRALLLREPDEEGMTAFVSALNNGQPREEILQIFLDSDEYKTVLAENGL